MPLPAARAKLNSSSHIHAKRAQGPTVGIAVGVSLGVLVLISASALAAFYWYLRRKRGRQVDGDKTIYKPVAAADIDLDDGPGMGVYHLGMNANALGSAAGSFNPYINESTLVGAQSTNKRISTSSAGTASAMFNSYQVDNIPLNQKQNHQSENIPLDRQNPARLSTSSLGLPQQSIIAIQRRETPTPFTTAAPVNRRAASADRVLMFSPPLAYGKAKMHSQRSASADSPATPHEDSDQRRRSHEQDTARLVQEKRQQNIAIAQNMELKLERTGRSVRRALTSSGRPAPPAYAGS